MGKRNLDVEIITFCSCKLNECILIFSDSSKDPIARKLRLRRGRRDQEEADSDQAKILKVNVFRICSL